MTAISATIFLVSINWTLITVRILENMTELSLGPAAAFSVFVIAVVIVVTSGLNWVLRRVTGAGPAASRGRGLSMIERSEPAGIRLEGVSATMQDRNRGEITAVRNVDLEVQPGEL